MSKKLDEKTYEVITQEDENGDLIVPIPPILLQQLNWNEGDSIDVSVDPHGRIIFKKIPE